jgi:hypothetical protein
LIGRRVARFASWRRLRGLRGFGRVVDRVRHGRISPRVSDDVILLILSLIVNNNPSLSSRISAIALPLFALLPRVRSPHRHGLDFFTSSPTISPVFFHYLIFPAGFLCPILFRAPPKSLSVFPTRSKLTNPASP